MESNPGFGFAPNAQNKKDAGKTEDGNKKTKFGRFVEEATEVGGGIAVGALLETFLKNLFSHFSKKTAEGVVDKVSNHPALQSHEELRGAIFEDIRTLEKKSRKNDMSFLWNRIAEDQENNREYRLIAALGRIPKLDAQGNKSEQGNRQAGLLYLNNLGEVDYRQRINLLETDNIPQFLLHFWAATREIFGGLSKDAASDLKKAVEAGEKEICWLAKQANKAAPFFNKFADKLDERELKRMAKRDEPLVSGEIFGKSFAFGKQKQRESRTMPRLTAGFVTLGLLSLLTSSKERKNERS